jgi:PhoPQ-activated pathogenicity-related protein
MSIAFSRCRACRTAAAIGVAIWSLVGVVRASGADLAEMVHRADPAYRWQIQRSTAMTMDVDLLSQRWRDSAWRHAHRIVRPPSTRHPNVAILIVGSDMHREFVDETALADASGAIVARLDDVPNQPLYGHREDALIAYTFEQYLRTGDADWPLLVPMTRAAVKAMDAISEIVAREWRVSIERYFVTGASKRGWTSWLAAATDPRVAGVVPVVFDNLDFDAQMKNQKAIWNEYSAQIGDYTERSLPMLTETEGGRKLIALVDPYSYRDKLARVPKLIVNGTNDPYWELDAINLYWDHLRGEKSVLEVPNAGHAAGSDPRVLPTIAAFVDRVSNGKAMPELRWSGKERDAKIVASEEPRSVTMWVAQSPTRDFRRATWRPVAARRDGDGYAAEPGLADVPRDRYVAVLAEAAFTAEAGPFTVSTPVRIRPPDKSVP